MFGRCHCIGLPWVIVITDIVMQKPRFNSWNHSSRICISIECSALVCDFLPIVCLYCFSLVWVYQIPYFSQKTPQSVVSVRADFFTLLLYHLMLVTNHRLILKKQFSIYFCFTFMSFYNKKGYLIVQHCAGSELNAKIIPL